MKAAAALLTTCALLAAAVPPLRAQEVAPPADHILLTVFLKHDQSKTIDEIQAELAETGFWRAFPPEGVEVVSWNVAMGLGQVVTLRVPPDRLRAVNVTLERTAWSAFRTEFYATYDLLPVVARLREDAAKSR